MSEIPMYPDEAESMEDLARRFNAEIHDRELEIIAYRSALEAIVEDCEALAPHVPEPARSGALLGIKVAARNALEAYRPSSVRAAPECASGTCTHELCRHCGHEAHAGRRCRAETGAMRVCGCSGPTSGPGPQQEP